MRELEASLEHRRRSACRLPAVSQLVRALEARLEIRLLNRTTRAVSLTDAGEKLLSEAAPLVHRLDLALEGIRSLNDEPSGPLRINTPRIAAMTYLAPVISEFCQRFPKVALEITVADTVEDIVLLRYDAGIRPGERIARNMKAIRISPRLRMAAVAAPTYLASRGTPSTPAALADHDCIGYRWPSSGEVYKWEFQVDGQAVEVQTSGPLISNDMDIMLQAAIDGLGIVYCKETEARQAIEKGQLVEVLRDFTPSIPGFYLYHPSDLLMPLPLKALIDFLTSQLVGPRD